MNQNPFPIAPPTPRDNINYPGVPLQPGDEPPPIAARTTSRASVTYEVYVLQYAARQRGHVLLATAGILLALGAVYLIDNTALLVLFIALGVGGVMTGGIGFAIAADAHASYTQHLAIATSTTYTEPRPPAQGERPFVPTANREATIRAGRFALPMTTWRTLFETAAANNGRLTRDAASRVLPRPLYRDWQTTVAELQRLGLIDADATPTAAAWSFIGRRAPLPQAAPTPPRAPSTHARRTPAPHEALETVEQWGQS